MVVVVNEEAVLRDLVTFNPLSQVVFFHPFLSGGGGGAVSIPPSLISLINYRLT